jgi:nitrogen fixation NifU-like protein
MQMPDGLDDLYQEIILDHYRSPRHKGALEHADLKAEGFNPFCGDQVILTLGLDDDGRIDNVGFEGQGCSISQASVSMLTGHLTGKTLDELEGLVRSSRA